MHETPIFITGMYKSGTSWLLAMLAAHPGCGALREIDVIRAAFGEPGKPPLKPRERLKRFFDQSERRERLKRFFGQSAFCPLKQDFGEQVLEEVRADGVLPVRTGPIHDQEHELAVALLQEIFAAKRNRRNLDPEAVRRVYDELRGTPRGIFGGIRTAPRLAEGARPYKPLSFQDFDATTCLNLWSLVSRTLQPRRCVVKFMDLISEALPAEMRLVVKGADQMPHFDRLDRMFPSARKVAIVRDGRDACISALAYRDLMRERGMAWTGKETDYWTLLRAWKERAEMVLRHSGDGRMSVVRYEDMLDDVDGTLTELLREVGLEHSESTVADIVDQTAFEKVTGGRKPGEEAKSIVRKGQAGEWQEELTEDDMEEAWRIAGPTLEAFGYPRSPGL